MIPVKVGTAITLKVFMADSTDHVSGKTGLTLSCYLSKNGETSFASISPAQTGIGYGWYNVTLTASHINTYGPTALHITGSGADPTDILLNVVGYDPYDAESLGLENIANFIHFRLRGV